MTTRFGHPRLHLESIDSTNSRARAWIPDGAPAGACVTADFQTAGRGRQERTWTSEAGRNLLVSYIAMPERDPEEWGGLALLCGLAVIDAVRNVSACDAHLKWPNDVLIGRRKVAGVLIETGHDGTRAWAVLGIGVNVTQNAFSADMRLPATSLRLSSGDDIRIEAVFNALSDSLGHWYTIWETEGNAPIIRAWKQRSRMIGKEVTAQENDGEAMYTAVDLHADGSLIVADTTGATRSLHAGDVSIIWKEPSADD
jgi:BirA family transcriptional regulator, biotin operon repressor / biotin---[acetyl-CoA-carboxylase] ligase